ncbi:MAG: FG-GAP-like repeat-containing protein [Wenzhouxiangella sp.]
MSRFLPVVVLLSLVVLSACGQRDAVFEPSDEQIERNNRGVALMGQYRNEDARQVFAALHEQAPEWVDVEVNMAIAILNRQEEGDEFEALRITEALLEQHPDHARARYVAALMRLYTGDTERALEHFRQVSALAPEDAHVAYFTGQALSQLGDTEAALGEYERAMALDPYLRSSYYGAALAYRQLGDTERARELLTVYQRFANNPRAQLAEFVYTRKGVLAEALAVSRAGSEAADWRFDGDLFGPAETVLAMPGQAPVTSLTVADISGNQRLDVFLTGGQRNRVLLASEQGFELADDHPLAAIDSVQAALWADFDNSGQLDVLLCREGESRLLSKRGGDWTEALGQADFAALAPCRDGLVLDADHDGDLDVLLLSTDAPVELFNNNLNGSWRRLSDEPHAGFQPDARPVRYAIAADLDGDRDADLVLIHQQAPHQVLRNDRLWQYQPHPGFDGFRQADIQAVTAADFDARGQVDLVTLDGQGGLWRWRADEQGAWHADRLFELSVDGLVSPALASLDFSGDGRPDLLVQHQAGFHVLAVDDQGQTRLLHEEAVALTALTPILIDPALGPSLLGVVEGDEGDELKLWPASADRARFVAIAPSGMTDPGDGMRSNASGIGTGLLVRVGSRWSITDTYPRHSSPGQSLQPAAIGLGGRDRADFVQFFWSDGVLQTEMDLVSGEVHRISELQRQLASCPVLFAWNGERHEFVSDLLGVAGIGFFQEPGRYSQPRPWEFFLFPPGSIAPRDGRFELKIAEPMEEIAYIDTARLQVYDLPPGWSMSLDERMFTGGGPQPTGAPVFWRDEHWISPVSAINDRGEDVTEAILTMDHVAADPGPIDPRFLGRLARDHVLTLDFGQVINPTGRTAVMVADGWVEYPYSQTLFAAWQAGAAYRPPSLEAYAEGEWTLVHPHWGYPAGMPRNISLPLDALPAETTALRLSGNWEVYWDRIGIAWVEEPPENLAVHDLPIVEARLARTGFARRYTFDQRLPFYDYADRSPFWDTKYPAGFYTDFGPVEPLVTEANNAFAIFGPGEELHLEFEAPVEPPEDFRREVVLEVRGFAKDMDLYTDTGETVEPLPFTPGVPDDQRDALHERFLNRFQGGR